MRNTLLTGLALVALASLGAHAQAAPEAPASPYLLGDADGSRAGRKESGFVHDLLWTNYYQGSVSGPEPDGMKYGGRFDLYLAFDAEKLWNWRGGGVSSHIEYRYGENSLGQGGTLLPTNAASILPLGSPDELIVSSLHLTQKFSRGMLLAGKINTVDLLAGSPMLGGRGLEGFSNIEFAAPVSGLVPPTIFGAVLVLPGKPNWTFMVFDPEDQTRRSGLESPFNSGVNLGATASWPATLTRHGGSQSLGVTVSTAEGIDLADIAQIAVPDPDRVIGSRRGKYVVSYQVEQLLTPSWGAFLKVSKADANPNIHDYSYQLGVGGKGLFAARPADRFGLGYYRFAFSRVLGEVIEPTLAIAPESGVEAFYNVQVTPGMFVTANVQWISPARQDRDSSVFAGVRVMLRL